MESLDTTILNTAVPIVAKAIGTTPLNMRAVLACDLLPQHPRRHCGARARVEVASRLSRADEAARYHRPHPLRRRSRASLLRPRSLRRTPALRGGDSWSSRRFARAPLRLWRAC